MTSLRIDRLFNFLKISSQKNSVQAGIFLGLVLCIFFFDVIFLNRTLSSLQVPGVLGGGPYGYKHNFSHRALIDPGGSTWGPRSHTILVSQQLKDGVAPLWNPYMGIGQPLAGNMDSNAFTPLRLFLHLFPTATMWDFFLLFRLFIAGFFAYFYLRAIKLSHISSLFSSVLYMCCGYFIFCIDMHHLDVEVFLPFMFLCYEKITQKQKCLKWGLLCSLGTVFLITGGQPQSAFLILAFGFFYYFFRLLYNHENRTPSMILKFSILYLFFHFLGILLCAGLLFPFSEFRNLSLNNHDPSRFLGLSYNPYISDFISFITPYFLGPIHGSWLKDYSWHILTRGYFGVTALLFAIVAVLEARKNKSSNNSLIYFFAIAAILMISKFYGFYIINWIGKFPIANMVNFGKYMGPLMSFCVIVLAGFGLEKMSKLELNFTAVKRAALLLVTLIVCTFFYTLHTMMDQSVIRARLAKFLPLFSYSVVNYVLLELLVTLLFIVAIIVTTKLCLKQKFLKLQNFKYYIFFIALVESYFYIPNPGFEKDRNKRWDIFTKAPYIEFLQSHLKEYRVIGADRIFYPDFGSAYQIGDLRVLDALLPKRYMEFVGNFFKLPSPPDRFTGDEGIDFQNPGTQRALNLLGVKYFISHTDIKVPNLVYDQEAKIYQNEDVFPRAFIVHDYETITDKEEILKKLKNPDFPIKDKIILEEKIPDIIPKTAPTPFQKKSVAQIKQLSSQEVEILANMKRPGFLVLSDLYYPGWNAYVNGKKEKIYQTDYILRSVFLNQGTYTVKFIYEPQSFKTGKWLSGLGLITFFLLFLGYFFKRHRN